MTSTSRLIRAAGVVVLLSGCANQGGQPVTNTRTPTTPSDRVLIKTDNQAAMQALSRDHQAVTRASSEPASTRASEEIVSSLKMAVATIAPSQAATTQPTENNVSGTVTFTQVGSILIVVAELSGLLPNSTHSLEIHESADLSTPDLSSAGYRWDPSIAQEQPGQLGNLDADAIGNVYFERTLGHASINGENSVVGHSIIVRANAGDRIAGDRIAAGVIARHEQ